jgi:soluble lytic murein transglycosylase-like protein
VANYQKAAERAARRYGLNPNVFKAMIRQESGFNPNARSPVGAQGIAQFMPATAREYGVNLNDNRAADDLDGAARYLCSRRSTTTLRSRKAKIVRCGR